jgi:aryl-alcohol dehydrogenase-like predicted oxidoreductase
VPKGARLDTPGMEWLREAVLKKPGIEKRLAAIPRLAAIAKGVGTSLPCLSIAWCLRNPNISTVILGASKVEQLSENLGALDVIAKLTPQVMKEIDAISAPLAD